MVIDHNHPKYRARWNELGANRFNGAYYYSKEIVKYIIPRVKTDRPWVTINIEGECLDRAIVFIHNNLYPERYEWLKKYKDLVLVCGVPETVDKVKHLGTAVYLPLSIRMEDIEKYRTEKTQEIAFAGRKPKRNSFTVPRGVDILEGLPREKFLEELAKYRNVYAVGRTALEARYLGARVLPYDQRFPDPTLWEPIDSEEAAEILQKKIDAIERRKKCK